MFKHEFYMDNGNVYSLITETEIGDVLERNKEWVTIISEESNKSISFKYSDISRIETKVINNE